MANIKFTGNVSALAQVNVVVSIKVTQPNGLTAQLVTSLLADKSFSYNWTTVLAGTYTYVVSVPEDITYSAATTPTQSFVVPVAKLPRTITATTVVS